MAKYEHSPLDIAKQEIRLLVIEAIAEDELRCHVEHSSLLETPNTRYSAISYRWGRTSDQKTLSIDGQPFMVPASAVEALRGTHQTTAGLDEYAGKARYWIDVICIDQANLEEKAAQVALMGEIYARAARTLVWLGQAPSCSRCRSSADAFGLVAGMAEYISHSTHGLTTLKQHLWSEREEDERMYRACGLDMPLGDDWHPLDCLFAREWFLRLWCIQEVALSRETICCWGVTSMNFGQVSLVARWLVSVTNWQQEAFSRGMDDAGRKGIDNAACMWDQWKGKLPPKLDMLLYTGYWFETSDSLDKVYGFLGIWRTRADAEIAATPEHLDLLQPNYRAPVAKVYAKAARAAILVSRSLAILDVTDAGRIDAEDVGVPSWVPRLDLSFSRPVSPEAFSAHSVGASDGAAIALASNDDWNVLTVRGVVVDQIKETYVIPDSAATDAFDSLVEWMIERTRANSVIEAQRVLAEILTAGNDSTPVASHVESLQGRFHSPQITADVNEDDSTKYRALGQAAAIWSRARAVLFTEQCYLGIVRATVRPGDIVCVLLGSRKPVVLRTCGDRWMFVGVAFVHGIMQGEHLKLLKKHGRLEEVERWFSIC